MLHLFLLFLHYQSVALSWGVPVIGFSVCSLEAHDDWGQSSKPTQIHETTKREKLAKRDIRFKYKIVDGIAMVWMEHEKKTVLMYIQGQRPSDGENTSKSSKYTFTTRAHTLHTACSHSSERIMCLNLLFIPPFFSPSLLLFLCVSFPVLSLHECVCHLLLFLGRNADLFLC